MTAFSRVATRAENLIRARLARAMARPLMWELKAAYEKGQSRQRNAVNLLEPADARIAGTGQALRQNILEEYHLKYRDCEYRILFQLPQGGVGRIWFQDLKQCLEHTGVPCDSIPQEEPHLKERWEAFQPNVFISMDSPRVLDSLDLNFIVRYKEARGCLRLFTPIVTYRFPKPGLSAADRWRLKLACAGKSVDAYFSMMSAEFFIEFHKEWAQAGFEYLPLPNGSNPLRHYPVDSVKDVDYFMVTSWGPQRARITRRYLKPIFKDYHGIWAGAGWGFGEGFVAPDELRGYYARARVAPNPLMPYLVRFPAETTERSFTAPACGAFQITNSTPVTHRFFTGEELVCVKNEKEFIAAFAHYVDQPDERNRIALRGLRRVFTEHTYFHRIDRLMEFLHECAGLF